MPCFQDGPCSPIFESISLKGNVALNELSDLNISEEMSTALEHALNGACIAWGIPFVIGDVVVIVDQPITVDLSPTKGKWFIFMHTSDVRPLKVNSDGFVSPMRGEGQLAEHAADYTIIYEDKTEVTIPILRRRQVGPFQYKWGDHCFDAVAHRSPFPQRASHEQLNPEWGSSQTRVTAAPFGPWVNWLWAWENPYPEKAIVSVKFKPVSGIIIISALSFGSASSNPLRWRTRRKAVLTLPEKESFNPELDEQGLLQQIQLDMGQVISARPRLIYPNDYWDQTYNNKIPEISDREILIEYTSHPDACFHFSDGKSVPVSGVENEKYSSSLQVIGTADQKVTIKVIEKNSQKCVPVKLHVHGEFGEYLPPIDRHRIVNYAWFEDYNVDFSHRDTHQCTYIPGETTIKLPLGSVYIEVSKGFEIRPVRKVIEVTPSTEEIIIEIEKVLPWRERGWITADTHVHFLSPITALLEGSAEGVNIINLLASQWGELMTNAGDFDGKTTWGSKEAGGDGEYLVRVGTENRQHVLGHISLLGYRGKIIAPMTTGGPDESALGDPIEVLLTEWARRCKKQGGLVVLPHFPKPRAEYAVSLVSEDIDAIEMTSWGELYGGIDPYSLSDWYRFLNCGYLTAAVGGTDKMSARTAVGTVRTYAYIGTSKEFSYGAWMNGVRRAETFVTYGPLLEFMVDGHPMGSRIKMSNSGGTVDVSWQIASITIPMSRVELIINGEIKESKAIAAREDCGSWSIKITKSCWLALLVRGHYTDKPEIIAAHSSPVMVDIEGSTLLAAADAVTILEQIEGAMAYLDTIGTRADDVAYKRMRLIMESAHRSLHNRMHQLGYFHDHSPVTNHPGHE